MVNLGIYDLKISNHEKGMVNHNLYVEKLNLSSNHSNGLEIASYGLSEPKTVSKKKSKVNSMISKQIKTKAQSNEQTKIETTQELVISSKSKTGKKKNQCPECLGKMSNGKCLSCGWTPEIGKVLKKLETLEVETKTEVVSMDKKKNEPKKRVVKKKPLHKKQRKGKSLLTAFRINRMERRTFLSVDSGRRFTLNMDRGTNGKYC